MRQPGISHFLVVFLLSFLTFSGLQAQMITGTWKGRINRQKAEVKIIQQGDSLTGTSYYYESSSNYRRYSIKGYFDPATNEAVWWDDRLLEERSGKLSLSSPGRIPMLARADFNCPGGGRMMLDGKAGKKTGEVDPKADLHLDKTGNTQFPDEWDFVIDNFMVGANDPEIIDSVAAISLKQQEVYTPPVPATTRTTEITPRAAPPTAIATPPTPSPPPASPAPVTEDRPVKTVAPPDLSKPPVKTTGTLPAPVAQAPKLPDIVEKFRIRQKVFVKEIPVSGDSIELRFYDNAEIDGDSISVFLNDRLLFSHIRLTGAPYLYKLAVSELAATNELTMVAENLGSIPPNTSYMVAFINGIKYDAYLSSSEGSSAMIRLTKKVP